MDERTVDRDTGSMIVRVLVALVCLAMAFAVYPKDDFNVFNREVVTRPGQRFHSDNAAGATANAAELSLIQLRRIQAIMLMGVIVYLARKPA